ncbi:MAG: Mur ligase domain-containing protein, partial [bacterium]|nr:Mur ligase domain-containing protein [bacterium]
MTFSEATHIHIMGIGGIGVSAIGRLGLHLGKTVSGCDVEMTAITKDLAAKGAKVVEGHNPGHVEGVNLLVYSPAVPENNFERMKARELGITEMSYPEVLGELSRQYKTIAVAGTNGKTTTTAMTGLVLEALGMDPTVIVGSNVKQWDGNFRAGNSE